MKRNPMPRTALLTSAIALLAAGAAVAPLMQRDKRAIVAAALGRKFGVEIGVGGQDACTDGKRIQIPDVPDDPASRDLAWGYLAHEAAHEAPQPEKRHARAQFGVERDQAVERRLPRLVDGAHATFSQLGSQSVLA